MLPLLRFAAKTDEISNNEAVDTLAKEFRLTEEEVNELLPSGVQPRFFNRIGWASTYLKKCSPPFFERVVVDLLVRMGYGGSRADAGRAIGRSGDGGIDGIIKEDKLGLDVVYIQAKRWDSNSVGRPDVMQFAGALQGQRANKGIFITTSRFTDDARNYVSQIGSKIVLIDGQQLTALMIEHDVGVSTIGIYPVKKIDGDFFDEGV